MAEKQLPVRTPLLIAFVETAMCLAVLAARALYVYVKIDMWLYIVTALAVALFPLALAGYGGHLATLALADKPRQKRTALLIVWSLAIMGVLFFVLSEVVAYKSDVTKNESEKKFRVIVLAALNHITAEPDQAKRKDDATLLKSTILNSPSAISPPPQQKVEMATVVPSVDASASSTYSPILPSYEPGSPNTAMVYPENFYTFLPLVWKSTMLKMYDFQGVMVHTYQAANRLNKPKQLNISYLQGNQASYSLALYLQRVYGNAGWDARLLPRTDIGHVVGIYVFQNSIEIKLDGVAELSMFAKDSNIPFELDGQDNIPVGTFELWVGRGPKD